jgi:hypothetical protein
MKVNFLKQVYTVFGAKVPYGYAINLDRKSGKTAFFSDSVDICFRSLGNRFQVKVCRNGTIIVREIKKENGVNTSIETLIVIEQYENKN